MALVGDKDSQMTLGEVEGMHAPHVLYCGMGAFVECLKVGEVEGVMWAVRAQLKGVIKNVRDLMIKLGKGLALVMGLVGGSAVAQGTLPPS